MHRRAFDRGDGEGQYQGAVRLAHAMRHRLRMVHGRRHAEEEAKSHEWQIAGADLEPSPGDEKPSDGGRGKRPEGMGLDGLQGRWDSAGAWRS